MVSRLAMFTIVLSTSDCQPNASSSTTTLIFVLHIPFSFSPLACCTSTSLPIHLRPVWLWFQSNSLNNTNKYTVYCSRCAYTVVWKVIDNRIVWVLILWVLFRFYLRRTIWSPFGILCRSCRRFSFLLLWSIDIDQLQIWNCLLTDAAAYWRSVRA